MPRVGFGKADITPELGLPMVGMPGSPRAEGVAWPLQARVMLADDGERRAAVVCLDLIGLTAGDVAALRTRLAGPGGLAPEHLLIACSHTHRAPFATSGHSRTDGGILTVADGREHPYLDGVTERLLEAMGDAAAALQPARLSAGRTLAPGWAFNRRPMYAGGQVGTHGWAWAEGFERMEDAPDDEISVLLARTPVGEVLGGLVGFACHPTAMGHDPVYSADYAGVLTETLEARHGGIFGFLIGAAGDTSTPDPTSRDPESGFGREHTLAMGAALADRADAAIAAARAVRGDDIRVAATHLPIAQRRATPELVEMAHWYLEERPPDLDELAFTRRFYGHDHTFADGKQVGNERHAQEMLGMWAWQQGPDAQLVEEIELQALVFGDVAIVAFPAEMFTEFGRRLKANSPFTDTLVATMANGWHGYVPTREAFSRGGYEPRFALPSRLVETAGDEMIAAAERMLRQPRETAEAS